MEQGVDDQFVRIVLRAVPLIPLSGRTRAPEEINAPVDRLVDLDLRGTHVPALLGGGNQRGQEN